MNDESSRGALISNLSNIDSLIILDRRVDMITPLLTQLTYQGLIDELIGIKNYETFPHNVNEILYLTTAVAHTELPLSLLQPPAPVVSNAPSSSSPPVNVIPVVSVKKENKKKYHLSAATDPLFAELRDVNFSSIGKRLNSVARRLDEDYKVCRVLLYIDVTLIFSQTNLTTKTVAQLRDFVGKLGGLQTEHQSLRLRTHFSQYVRNLNHTNFPDTGISEIILPLTKTEVFNKSLEIQQSKRIPLLTV